jgi:Acyl-CoA oxidase
MKNFLREGLSEAEARNRCAVDLIRASKAHSYYVMAFCFRSAIDKAKSTAPIIAENLERSVVFLLGRVCVCVLSFVFCLYLFLFFSCLCGVCVCSSHERVSSYVCV